MGGALGAGDGATGVKLGRGMIAASKEAEMIGGSLLTTTWVLSTQSDKISNYGYLNHQSIPKPQAQQKLNIMQYLTLMVKRQSGQAWLGGFHLPAGTVAHVGPSNPVHCPLHHQTQAFCV